MGTFSPLRVRPFGRLLTAYTVNEIGDSFAILALAVLVFDETKSATALAGLFLAGKFVPALVAPVLTARLDQLTLARSIPGLYFAEAIVFVALAVLAEDFLLPAVLALALVDGTLALTGRSVLRGGMARTLEPVGLVREGNGLTNIGFAAAVIGGSALAGLVVDAAGVATALLIDAASFAMAGAIILTVREGVGARVERQKLGTRLSEGLRFVRTQARLRLLLTGEALALVFFTIAVPIEVLYAKETLDAGDDGFGLLMASWGAGLVLGSSLFVALRRRSINALVLGSTAAVGLAYGGWAVVDTLPLACSFAVLGGAGNGMQWVSVMTLLQESVPTDLQARVVGLLESVGAAAPGLGFLVGGVIASLSSPQTAFAVAGAGVVAVVLAVGAVGRGLATPGARAASKA